MASKRPQTQAHVAALRYYEERKRVDKQHPSLTLHCYATPRGVALHACVDQWGSDGRLHRTEIAQAVWKPAKVTERLVVEWGERALRRWLETNLEDPGTAT